MSYQQSINQFSMLSLCGNGITIYVGYWCKKTDKILTCVNCSLFAILLEQNQCDVLSLSCTVRIQTYVVWYHFSFGGVMFYLCVQLTEQILMQFDTYVLFRQYTGQYALCHTTVVQYLGAILTKYIQVWCDTYVSIFRAQISLVY